MSEYGIVYTEPFFDIAPPEWWGKWPTVKVSRFELEKLYGKGDPMPCGTKKKRPKPKR